MGGKKQRKGLIFGSKANKKAFRMKGFLCDPAGTRTQDPYIKSVLLYQLSYGISSSFGVICMPVIDLGVQKYINFYLYQIFTKIFI